MGGQQTPSNTRHQALAEFPDWQWFMQLQTMFLGWRLTVAGSIKRCPHDSTGRGQWKPAAGLSWTLPVHFYALLTLHPFTVIIITTKITALLSSVS